MATGRQTKLTGQTGEYLVASQLSRRGLIATTFTGNVPHYDIIASTEKGKHISVQVKTITGSTWQFAKVNQFIEITFKEHVQIVGKCLPSPVDSLVFVFVQLGEYGSDKFYICTWQELTDIMSRNHSEYLEKHGGIRPKTWNSLHISIGVKDISHFENRWELIEKMLK
jgi:hypothetical protein